MAKKSLIELFERREVWKENPDTFFKEFLNLKLPFHQKDIIKAVRKYKKTAVRSANSIGKCQYEEDYIILANGEKIKAKEVKNKNFKILSFDEKTGKQVVKNAWAEDNGLKPCYKITTESGLSVIRTDNHLLYSSELIKANGRHPITNKRLTRFPENIGWKRCDELTEGNLILAPEKIEIKPTKFDFLDDEAKLLGYFLGDGSTTINAGFSQKNNICREEFINIIEKFGCTYRIEKSNNYDITVSSINKNPKDCKNKQNFVLNKIKEWGLFGKKAVNKLIPNFVFTLPQEQIALILNRFYSCDGYVYKNKNVKKYNELDYVNYCYKIGITLANELLIDQIKSLLLRFGIYSWKRYKKSKFKDKEFDAWELVVTKREDIEKFHKYIGIYGKSEKLEEAYLYSKNNTSKDKEIKYKKLNCLNGYRWEKISKIEYIGELPTIAIEVKDTHTYLTDICEHNSFCISGLILWFFYCFMDADPKKNLIILFTAPTFDQVRENIFANVKEFIEQANEFVKREYGENIDFISKISDNQNLAEIRFRNKDFIKGVSSSGENKTVGKHGTYVLVIYDEAQGIPDKIYSDFRGIIKGGKVIKEVMIGNTTLPNGKTGEFYESFGPNSVFHQIKISAFDTPAFVEPNIVLEDYFREDNDPKNWRNKIDTYCKTDYWKALKEDSVEDWELEVKSKLPFAEHLVSPIDVYEELIRCGMDVNSYEFLTRILAEFPTENSSAMYPSDWISKAMENYHNPEAYEYGPTEMGVDVAGGLGRDQSSIAVRCGNKVIYSESFDLNAPDLVDKIVEISKEFPDLSKIKIERDAIGKGHYDFLLLRQNELPPIIPIVSGSGPGFPEPFTLDEIEQTKLKKEMFNRKRDEICWNIRELLNPVRADESKSILLPPSIELKKQMAAYSYVKMPKGQILVSSKEMIKKVIKKSPDKFDAIAFSFAETEIADPFSNINFIGSISGN